MKPSTMRTFVALLFTCLLLFFLDTRGLLSGPRGTIEIITVPITYSVHSVQKGLEETFSFLTFWRSGEQRIKNLELRMMELRGADSRAKSLENENNELRKQLGAGPKISAKLLPAPTLGIGRYLEIGVGEKDGVKINQTVIYLEFLVGRVIKVTPNTSFVQLLTDPQSKVPVRVAKAHGLALGQFNSSIIVDRLTQTDDISSTKEIFTSGEDGSFPPDLIVGNLGKVVSLPAEIFKRVTVDPAINVLNLTTVFVVF